MHQPDEPGKNPEKNLVSRPTDGKLIQLLFMGTII
jgi:hypothetical protein